MINTDPQYLGVEAFELGEIQLESQSLVRSDAAKCSHEEKHQDIFLALVIRQAYRFANRIEGQKVWGFLSDVESVN